jgi:di/tricarboxylate transporter
LEHVALLLILAVALALLISNRIPPDGVGLAIIVALILAGRASPAEAFAGFGHPATLTVAAVLILSAGVQRTGVVDGIALWLRRHARATEKRLLRMQTLIVAPVSAFLSNTATVATFLPVILSVTRDRGFSPSRFLMPLSFASLLGGMCTLIGTSTNIVVSTLAADHDLEPMRMFDFVPVGITIAFLGFVYLTVIAPRFMPKRRKGRHLEEAYHLRRYLTEIEILPGSHLADRTLEQSNLSELYDLDVLEIHRRNVVIGTTPNTMLRERDVLLVHAALETIRRIQDTEGIRLRSEGKIDLGDLASGGMVLAEAVVPPGSPLENRTLKQAGFRNRYGVTALALYHHREYIRERVGRMPLRIGDVLLLYGLKARLRELAGYSEVLGVVKVLPPRPRRKLSRLSLLIVAITVAGAASGFLSLATVVVSGAALMVVTGCLTLRETYRAIDRRTILLLAGMISMGLAMERSGTAEYLALHIMDNASTLGPWFLLAATYLATAIFTELVTNNACAVIMTPIAIAAAHDFGLDPRPFVFAVAYAASASFLTPWGYQTNMFVYGAGGYRTIDFLRMGFPLSIIAFLVSMALIPMLWPMNG